MEHENNYGSKGVAGAGLGLGIAGTALGLLSGNLANIFGGNAVAANCHEKTTVSHYELSQQARIAELETEVKLRDANTFTLGEMNNFRNYVDGKFDAINAQLCQQNVYNATNTAAIGCIQAQIAQLMSLTKVVIPNGSICPGWGNVTVAPATTTA
jgi:hypothetical protein